MNLPHRLDQLDRAIAGWMHEWGHAAHRYALGAFFVWVGVLKCLGFKSATSLLAHTVYLGDPGTTVFYLGLWEALIGATLLVRPLNRVALLLLAVRLPATALALVLKADVCWVSPPFVPSPEGQYLIKDLILFTAAMVIGGTVRADHDRPCKK